MAPLPRHGRASSQLAPFTRPVDDDSATPRRFGLDRDALAGRRRVLALIGGVEPAKESAPAERTQLESLIRADYERCHPGEALEHMKRRAPFSKEDRRLLRDWVATAAARAAAERVRHVLRVGDARSSACPATARARD